MCLILFGKAEVYVSTLNAIIFHQLHVSRCFKYWKVSDKRIGLPIKKCAEWGIIWLTNHGYCPLYCEACQSSPDWKGHTMAMGKPHIARHKPVVMSITKVSMTCCQDRPKNLWVSQVCPRVLHFLSSVVSQPLLNSHVPIQSQQLQGIFRDLMKQLPGSLPLVALFAGTDGGIVGHHICFQVTWEKKRWWDATPHATSLSWQVGEAT